MDYFAPDNYAEPRDLDELFGADIIFDEATPVVDLTQIHDDLDVEDFFEQYNAGLIDRSKPRMLTAPTVLVGSELQRKRVQHPAMAALLDTHIEHGIYSKDTVTKALRHSILNIAMADTKKDENRTEVLIYGVKATIPGFVDKQVVIDTMESLLASLPKTADMYLINKTLPIKHTANPQVSTFFMDRAGGNIYPKAYKVVDQATETIAGLTVNHRKLHITWTREKPALDLVNCIAQAEKPSFIYNVGHSNRREMIISYENELDNQPVEVIACNNLDCDQSACTCDTIHTPGNYHLLASCTMHEYKLAETEVAQLLLRQQKNGAILQSGYDDGAVIYKCNGFFTTCQMISTYAISKARPNSTLAQAKRFITNRTCWDYVRNLQSDKLDELQSRIDQGSTPFGATTEYLAALQSAILARRVVLLGTSYCEYCDELIVDRATHITTRQHAEKFSNTSMAIKTVKRLIVASDNSNYKCYTASQMLAQSMSGIDVEELNITYSKLAVDEEEMSNVTLDPSAIDGDILSFFDENSPPAGGTVTASRKPQPPAPPAPPDTGGEKSSKFNPDAPAFVPSAKSPTLISAFSGARGKLKPQDDDRTVICPSPTAVEVKLDPPSQLPAIGKKAKVKTKWQPFNE